MTRKILWVLVSSLLVASLVLASCGEAAPGEQEEEEEEEAPPAKVYKWRIQSVWPAPAPAYFQSPSLEAFVDYCRRASNGRLDFQIFYPGMIVPAVESFEAVSKGVLEMTHLHAAYWMGKELVGGLVMGLPYTFSNYKEMSVYFYELGFIDIVREALAEHNIYYLGAYPSHHNTLLTTKPIRKVEDFKGLKLRALGLQAAVWDKAGASCVFLPGPDIYPSLEKGVIDGSMWAGPGGLWAMGFHEVTDYLLTPYPQMATSLDVLVNMDKWNELPDDLKAIMEGGAANILSRRQQHNHLY
ncbi:unnamed protein product [marine sediment metagenome]|uniref:Uncharacterized protein n=1 Tax=marine sediment metagenome TaxID=412755 RepID=X1Q0Y9_9ZZZZ